MIVDVAYKAQFKKFMDHPFESFELGEKQTLDDLLKLIIMNKSDDFKKFLLDEKKQRKKSILVFLNNKLIQAHENPTIDKDVSLTFMSAFSGG